MTAWLSPQVSSEQETELLIKGERGQAEVAVAFDPSPGGRGMKLSELEVSLGYKVSYRTARYTEKLCLEKNIQKIKGRRVVVF